jgi:hypothetical protein
LCVAATGKYGMALKSRVLASFSIAIGQNLANVSEIKKPPLEGGL